MVVCAEPVLPADCRRVWEPVDLDAGPQRAEGDGVALVAHNHMVPHRPGTTSKILRKVDSADENVTLTWESPHVMQLERPHRRENISSMLGLTRG